ncbi:MAG: glycosyltransferase family 4 protein [Hyphomicrobiaceae bacterium]
MLSHSGAYYRSRFQICIAFVRSISVNSDSRGTLFHRLKNNPNRKAASAVLRGLIPGRKVQVVARHTELLDAIIPQIREQGDIDPAVLAPGYNALASLKVFDAPDLLARNGVDAIALAALARRHPETVLVVSALHIGGAEKYAADISEALANGQAGNLMVLVTDQTRAEAERWKNVAILAPLWKANPVFWRDECRGEGWQNPTNLAKFLNFTQPANLIIVNTQLGFEAVIRHGRRLSQLSQIACAYFGLGVDALTAPWSIRFPRLTWPYATSLTDSAHVADKLGERYGRIPGPGVFVLPPRHEPAPEALFSARVSNRAARAKDASRKRRWVWISRIERWKGTAILAALAAQRPQDEFVLYGPMQESLRTLGLKRRNIRHAGQVADTAKLDLSMFDGFLFTSLFESMPNIVLEMVEHGLPMVLSDVGGLRETFDPERDGVTLVPHQTSVEHTAAAFSEALNAVADLRADAIATTAAAARAAVMRRHAPKVFQSTLAQYFGSPLS